MAREPELDLTKYDGMVRWYDPLVILTIVKGVILSAWFGRYADQRHMQGALDPADPDRLIKRADLSTKIEPDENGAVWVDFVADIGDGFDATYAVAYLLAQEALTVSGAPVLPRGSTLIIGGDLVYPSAGREEYWKRMRQPYMLAHPDDAASHAPHPELYAIPGNHDWYDGLTAFYGTFCRARDTKPFYGGLSIGNWRCVQQRSYFALRLPHDWWIWGIDIQLSGYVDQPQINYFRLMANQLEADSKVIVCTAEPCWLRTREYGSEKFDSLNYILNIVRGSKSEHNVKAILTGDLHHYNRYESPDGAVQFVTAGGGGAFSHSTYHLRNSLLVPELYEKDHPQPPRFSKLSLGRTADGEACYPSRDLCKGLLWRNLMFPVKNWRFSIGVGIIYWVVSWFVVSHEGGSWFAKWIVVARSGSGSLGEWVGLILTTVATSPILTALFAGLAAALVYFVDSRRTWQLQIPIGLVHAVIHIAVFLALAVSFWIFNEDVLGLIPGQLSDGITFALEMVFVSGFVGGLVFGIYLLVTSRWLKIHAQDSFAALDIDKFRNFLRLRLTANSLTIYPVGLAEVPKRHQWRRNPAAKEGKPYSIYQPETPLQPFLIEPPVEIRVEQIDRPASNSEVPS